MNTQGYLLMMTEAASEEDVRAAYKILKKMGFKVQMMATTDLPKEKPQTPNEKLTNEEVARQVIRGLWGTGADRKALLEDAGYDYHAIQMIVNSLMG